jgi:predicted Zn-dependent protease
MQVQELVETALQSSTTDGCIVIVSEHTETNVRWAANSLTTNGQMRTRNVTVAATIDRSDGTHAGILTRSVSNADELEDLVRAAETAARAADVADDAAPIVSNYDHNDDWDADPATTSVAVFEQFASGLGSLFKTWAAADLQLFGFAEHQMTSTYLGTSTGLRRRFDQPDGRVEVNGKSPDYARSALRSSSGWGGPSVASTCGRDGTRRSCRRPPSPT